MLLLLVLSFFGLPVIHSAAISPSLSLVIPHANESSTAATDIAANLNSSLPQDNDIDPRFTYEKAFVNQFLDRKSAYLNSLLALADLSTGGWTERLSPESIYSFSSYGDVTIRIHASQNPSSLQYRHAMWGLYSAIRESSANSFKATVLTLYWSPIVGKSRHKIGYVTLLGASSPSLNLGNSTENALEQAPPTHMESSGTTLANFTSGPNSNYISPALQQTATPDLKFGINLGSKALHVDAVFDTVCASVVRLASFPQSQAIIHPGFVKNDASATFLRWDCIYIEPEHPFKYRYAILALSTLPLYMYQHDQFLEARVEVYVDEMHVGMIWLYKNGKGEALDAQ